MPKDDVDLVGSAPDSLAHPPAKTPCPRLPAAAPGWCQYQSRTVDETDTTGAGDENLVRLWAREVVEKLDRHIKLMTAP